MLSQIDSLTSAEEESLKKESLTMILIDDASRPSVTPNV